MDLSFMVYNPEAPRLSHSRFIPRPIFGFDQFSQLTDICAIMDRNNPRLIDQIVVTDEVEHMITGIDAATDRCLYTSVQSDLQCPSRIAATSYGEIYVYDSSKRALFTFVRNASWTGHVDINRLVSLVTDGGCAHVIHQFVPTERLTKVRGDGFREDSHVDSMCVVQNEELVVAIESTRKFLVYSLVPDASNGGIISIARRPALARLVNLPECASCPFARSYITNSETLYQNTFFLMELDNHLSHVIDIQGACRNHFIEKHHHGICAGNPAAIYTTRHGIPITMSVDWLSGPDIYLDPHDRSILNTTDQILCPRDAVPVKVLHCITTDKVFVIRRRRTAFDYVLVSYDLRP